jgi:hypothetical protein
MPLAGVSSPHGTSRSLNATNDAPSQSSHASGDAASQSPHATSRVVFMPRGGKRGHGGRKTEDSRLLVSFAFVLQWDDGAPGRKIIPLENISRSFQ